MGSANSQRKYMFVKYLCRVSPESLQTFKRTVGLGFGCTILVFYH